MFTNGQTIQRHEVEFWIAQEYPQFAYFKANVENRPEPERGQTRHIITITGPDGQPIVAKDRTATYYSTSPLIGMPQIDVDWIT